MDSGRPLGCMYVNISVSVYVYNMIPFHPENSRTLPETNKRKLQTSGSRGRGLSPFKLVAGTGEVIKLELKLPTVR